VTRFSAFTAYSAICRRELRSLFISPLAWLVLSLVQLVLGVVFVIQLQIFLDPPKVSALSQTWGVTRVIAAPVATWGAFMLLLVIPVITMRGFSGEWRTGTMTLLLASPASSATIVLAKFSALAVFVAVQVTCIALLPLLLLIGSKLDSGLLLSQCLGLTLAGSLFAALGLLISSLTRQPAVAAAGTFGLLFVSWLLSWRGPNTGTSAQEWVHRMSWQLHLDPLVRGLVDSADVLYFVIFACTALILCIWRVSCLRRAG
jgi:ABC-2 type transport system permease protein